MITWGNPIFSNLSPRFKPLLRKSYPMKLRYRLLTIELVVLVFLGSEALAVILPLENGLSSPKDSISLQLKKRVKDASGVKDVYSVQNLVPSQTAVIICDMWDRHWCKGATERVTEMAPAINRFVNAARAKGMFIVHAPSDCMDYYKNTTARKRASRYKNRDLSLDHWVHKTGEEAGYPWPIDSLTEGCNDTPYCTPGKAWTRQISSITIRDEDAVSDSGSEIAALFQDRGIRNVLILGVHTNMCVIGRSFGIRSLKQQGYNVALVRDLTDAMYDSRQWPYVSHFQGLGLMINYIEQYLCPTVVSSDVTGDSPFRFKDDERIE